MSRDLPFMLITMAKQSTPPQNKTVLVTGLSNREFLDLYAGAGRIGLSGGITLIDKAICRAQRHLDKQENWGSWSHAFIFQGQRHDGHHWVIESDLQVHRKHVQLGVQENRVTKYHDEKLYTCLAVLDFGLTEVQIAGLLRESFKNPRALKPWPQRRLEPSPGLNNRRFLFTGLLRPRQSPLPALRLRR